MFSDTMTRPAPLTRVPINLKLIMMFMMVTGIASAQDPSAAGPHSTSTADHSKFEELQQPFKTGPEVTKACLGCHTEAAKQLHKTKH